MPEDFEHFALRVTPLLFRVAGRLTDDRDAREDLVQEALYRVGRAWNKIDTSVEHGRLDGYAVVTLNNCVRSWQRRAWRQREVTTDLLPELASRAPHAPPLTDQLGTLIGRLPPRQRAAVLLRYYLDLSEVQTAALLSCSVGTVKSQTALGLRKLRELIASDSSETIRSLS